MNATRVLLTAAAISLWFSPIRTLLAFDRQALPDRLIVGYWHNFTNTAGLVRLANVPTAYDVVNVAFAVPTTPLGATMRFVPAAELYQNGQDFANEVAGLKARGKKILISVGGANAPVRLNSATDVQSFVSSMATIITSYGFDGIDIDLEGESLRLDAGDSDFRAPVTTRVTNLIAALRALLAQFPQGLMLSAAPETAFVQGGYGVYGGVYGCYLPVLHALRDKLTYVHVQHYNTGSMYGRDGAVYQPATRDFHVAMADMLIAGFAVDAFGKKIAFPGLSPGQVLIGLPASADAAGSGFTQSGDIRAALGYLYNGTSFGGTYGIANPQGYPKFRGLMTWSINWDVHNNLAWSKDVRSFLDELVVNVADRWGSSNEGSKDLHLLENIYPNPLNGVAAIGFRVPDDQAGSGLTRLRLAIYDLLGREVVVLVNGPEVSGSHTVMWDASTVPTGVYFCRMQAGGFVDTRRLLLVR